MKSSEQGLVDTFSLGEFENQLIVGDWCVHQPDILRGTTIYYHSMKSTTRMYLKKTIKRGRSKNRYLFSIIIAMFNYGIRVL